MSGGVHRYLMERGAKSSFLFRVWCASQVSACEGRVCTGRMHWVPAYLGGPAFRPSWLAVHPPKSRFWRGAEGSSISSQRRPVLLIFLCKPLKVVSNSCSKLTRKFRPSVSSSSSEPQSLNPLNQLTPPYPLHFSDGRRASSRWPCAWAAGNHTKYPAIINEAAFLQNQL